MDLISSSSIVDNNHESGVSYILHTSKTLIVEINRKTSKNSKKHKKQKNYKNENPIPKLIDNKQQHMER